MVEQGIEVDHANLAGRLSHVEQNQNRIISLLDRLEEKVEKAAKINIPALGLGWSVLFGLVMLLGTMAVYNINTNISHLVSVDSAISERVDTFVPRGEHEQRWRYEDSRQQVARTELQRVENDLNDRITRLESDIQRDEARMMAIIEREISKARSDLDKSDDWILNRLDEIGKRLNGKI